MYTGRDELIEVIACHDDNGDFKLTRHNIPVADITRHRVFQSRMLATVNRQELSNSDAAEVTVQRSCAFTSLTYEMERPQYFTRTQKYQLAPPRLSMNDSLHRNGSLLLFQVVANLLLSEMYNQPQRSHYGYQTIYPSFADEWRDVNHGIQHAEMK
ncbi:PREDICTED: uncharacterized protein LOC106820932 [Priapulus caudatus]|uniref:Uncharacterized protein LOC106820932 n=1 Tax=Priapulus caudatus TaxID=37621 RepID=A0ABM1F9A0_PRICU|nr:PREDICTED: uncharacterized protein LOC106820932 [Priapulus caudatus]